jgi:ankyrin repeat protein
VNKNGCSVLHLAAQGNQALSIYYFSIVRGLDINVRDSRQSTPLHWACFTKSENALAYILSVPGVDIEAKEQNGFTPLHMAIQSVPAL